MKIIKQILTPIEIGDYYVHIKSRIEYDKLMDWHAILGHRWAAGEHPFDFNGYKEIEEKPYIGTYNRFVRSFDGTKKNRISFDHFLKIAYE